MGVGVLKVCYVALSGSVCVPGIGIIVCPVFYGERPSDAGAPHTDSSKGPRLCGAYVWI
jgi:hypothetical protein